MGVSASLGLILFAGDVTGFLLGGKVTLTLGSDKWTQGEEMNIPKP